MTSFTVVKVQAGPDCCSVKWAASHYMTPEDQRRIDDLEFAQCGSTFPKEWPHLEAGGGL